eukprot:jgi/Orpsp1_1/1178185/evm.model.c7180000064356.1
MALSVPLNMTTETDGECNPVNTLLGKDKSNNCCLEKGITCENGYIIKIEVAYHGLNGTIPPELGNLSKLEYLILNNNSLSGTIPPELGKLSNLKK